MTTSSSLANWDGAQKPHTQNTVSPTSGSTSITGTYLGYLGPITPSKASAKFDNHATKGIRNIYDASLSRGSRDDARTVAGTEQERVSILGSQSDPLLAPATSIVNRDITPSEHLPRLSGVGTSLDHDFKLLMNIAPTDSLDYTSSADAEGEDYQDDIIVIDRIREIYRRTQSPYQTRLPPDPESSPEQPLWNVIAGRTQKLNFRQAKPSSYGQQTTNSTSYQKKKNRSSTDNHHLNMSSLYSAPSRSQTSALFTPPPDSPIHSRHSDTNTSYQRDATTLFTPSPSPIPRSRIYASRRTFMSHILVPRLPSGLSKAEYKRISRPPHQHKRPAITAQPQHGQAHMSLGDALHISMAHNASVGALHVGALRGTDDAVVRKPRFTSTVNRVHAPSGSANAVAGPSRLASGSVARNGLPSGSYDSASVGGGQTERKRKRKYRPRVTSSDLDSDFEKPPQAKKRPKVAAPKVNVNKKSARKMNIAEQQVRMTDGQWATGDAATLYDSEKDVLKLWFCETQLDTTPSVLASTTRFLRQRRGRDGRQWGGVLNHVSTAGKGKGKERERDFLYMFTGEEWVAADRQSLEGPMVDLRSVLPDVTGELGFGPLERFFVESDGDDDVEEGEGCEEEREADAGEVRRWLDDSVQWGKQEKRRREKQTDTQMERRVSGNGQEEGRKADRVGLNQHQGDGQIKETQRARHVVSALPSEARPIPEPIAPASPPCMSQHSPSHWSQDHMSGFHLHNMPSPVTEHTVQELNAQPTPLERLPHPEQQTPQSHSENAIMPIDQVPDVIQGAPSPLHSPTTLIGQGTDDQLLSAPSNALEDLAMYDGSPRSPFLDSQEDRFLCLPPDCNEPIYNGGIDTPVIQHVNLTATYVDGNISPWMAGESEEPIAYGNGTIDPSLLRSEDVLGPEPESLTEAEAHEDEGWAGYAEDYARAASPVPSSSTSSSGLPIKRATSSDSSYQPNAASLSSLNNRPIRLRQQPRTFDNMVTFDGLNLSDTSSSSDDFSGDDDDPQRRKAFDKSSSSSRIEKRQRMGQGRDVRTGRPLKIGPPKLIPGQWPKGPDEHYCHQCRRKTFLLKMTCSCGRAYCCRCITLRYDHDYIVFDAAVRNFVCPACDDNRCTCDVHTRRRGEVYVPLRSNNIDDYPSQLRPQRSLVTKPKDGAANLFNQSIVVPEGPLQYWGVIYDFSGDKVGTAFMSGNGKQDVIVARPLGGAVKPRKRLFVGSIPPSWGYGPTCTLKPLPPSPKITKGSKRRVFVGIEALLHYPCAATTDLLEPDLIDGSSSAPSFERDYCGYDGPMSPLTPQSQADVWNEDGDEGELSQWPPFGLSDDVDNTKQDEFGLLAKASYGLDGLPTSLGDRDVSRAIARALAAAGFAYTF